MSGSSRQALTRLFLENSAALRRRLRGLVRSRADADDVVQEAFVRALEKANTVRSPAAFVYSTARNLAFDGFRNQKTQQKGALAEVALCDVKSSVDSLESQILAEERTRLLKDAVERLPPQCRTAFTLKVFQGCSYKEIAKTMGVSVRTVENHIAHGLQVTHQRLRRRFDNGTDENG